MRILIVALYAALLASGGSADLRSTVVPLNPPIAEAAIVGRATCRASTWLLNRSAELIELAQGSDRPVIRQSRHLRPGDAFWGLACLADGSLWTLESGHLLARLASDGSIVERHTMLFPQVQLFGAGDRFVFFGLPIIANRSLLSASARREPENVRPWTGLVGRSGFGPSPDIATNLAACGIGFDRTLPCWFSDDDRVIVSDGTVARTVALPSLRRPGIAQAAPIRDLAVVDRAIWVLAASPTAMNGRRVGTRLIRTNAAGIEQRSLELATPARTIVAADATSCVLLTVEGHLMIISNAGGSQ